MTESSAKADKAEPDNAEKTEEPTLLEQMGGISGLIYSSLPVVVFVLLNMLFGLAAAIWGSLGSAALITVVRVVRKEPLQPAISGFFGVGIAAFIAYRTGSAKGFFLFGIWASLVYGSVFLASVLVRWPLVGVIVSQLDGEGTAWRRDPRRVRAFTRASWLWVVLFLLRLAVQLPLYLAGAVVALGVARTAMGLPLFALGLWLTWRLVRRAARPAAT
jgi:hypothetical protein